MSYDVEELASVAGVKHIGKVEANKDSGGGGWILYFQSFW